MPEIIAVALVLIFKLFLKNFIKLLFSSKVVIEYLLVIYRRIGALVLFALFSLRFLFSRNNFFYFYETFIGVIELYYAALELGRKFSAPFSILCFVRPSHILRVYTLDTVETGKNG